MSHSHRCLLTRKPFARTLPLFLLFVLLVSMMSSDVCFFCKPGTPWAIFVEAGLKIPAGASKNATSMISAASASTNPMTVVGGKRAKHNMKGNSDSGANGYSNDDGNGKGNRGVNGDMGKKVGAGKSVRSVDVISSTTGKPYPTLSACESLDRSRRPRLSLLIDAPGWHRHLRDTENNNINMIINSSNSSGGMSNVGKDTTNLDKFFSVFFGNALEMIHTCPESFWMQFDLIVSYHPRAYLARLSSYLYPTPSALSSAPFSAVGAAADAPLPFAFSPRSASYGFVETFDRGAAWRQWMLSRGYERLIADSVSIANPTFPCILKTNKHGLKGPNGLRGANELIENAKQLDTTLSELGLPPRTTTTAAAATTVTAGSMLAKDAYTLEKPLSGMSNGIATAYGSAYQGQILALRCSIDSAVIVNNSAAAAIGQQPTWQQVLAYGEAGPRPAQRYYTPCGMRLINSMNKVIRNATYSGPFCVNYRRSAEGKMKILDMNPRICVTMMRHTEVLVSTLVPLAYRIRLLKSKAASTSSGTSSAAEITIPALPKETLIDIQTLVQNEQVIAEGKDCGNLHQSEINNFDPKEVKYVYSFYCDWKRPAIEYNLGMTMVEMRTSLRPKRVRKGVKPLPAAVTAASLPASTSAGTGTRAGEGGISGAGANVNTNSNANGEPSPAALVVGTENKLPKGLRLPKLRGNKVPKEAQNLPPSAVQTVQQNGKPPQQQQQQKQQQHPSPQQQQLDLLMQTVKLQQEQLLLLQQQQQQQQQQLQQEQQQQQRKKQDIVDTNPDISMAATGSSGKLKEAENQQTEGSSSGVLAKIYSFIFP